MAFCSNCGTTLEKADKFCGQCGTPCQDAQAQAAQVVSAMEMNEISQEVPHKINMRKLIVGGILGAVFWIGLFVIIFSFDGCSSTEGTFHASGDPLGDFEFTPTQCKSGEHQSFFGVVLLGEDTSAGGLKLVKDPRDGDFIQIEVPGSCDVGGDNCKVVTIDPDHCKRFDVDIRTTNTTVNDIRLLDGKLQLACTFPEGGRATADIEFESCD